MSNLEVEDAVNLLLHRSRIGAAGETPEAKAEAADIVKELGYLALAIEQAAAYIREASLDIYKFLPSYRKDRKTHHARLSKGNQIFYKASVSTTWHLSFQQIGKNKKDASKLLRLLSFLNPDGTLTDFLVAGKGGLDADRREIVTDDRRFHEALAELERFSLIGRQIDTNGGERITIHRLVQTVIKDEMPQELFSTLTETVVRLCASSFPTSRYEDNKTRSLKRRFQGQIVVSLSSIGDIESRELGLILRRIGGFLRDDGNHREAIELLERAVKVSGTVVGSSGNDTLNAMGALAWAYDVQGRWNEASALWEHLLQTYRVLRGEKDVDTLTTMGNLADTYRNQGRQDDAARMEEVVVESWIDLLGRDHPATLRAMGHLSATYWSQGRRDDALKLQEVALESRIRCLGEDHPDTLIAITNIAVHYMEGRLDESISLMEKSHEAHKRVLGDEHPGTLKTLFWLAMVYEKDGKLDESIALVEKSVEAAKRVLGENHPDTVKYIRQLEEQRKLKKDIS